LQKITEDSFGAKAEEWDLNPIRQKQSEKFFKRIAEVVPLDPKSKLIDFGAGTGLVGLRFAPYVNHLTMVDKSIGMLDVLKQKIATLGLDANQFDLVSTDIESLKNDEFDLLVSLMTFHHIENVEQVLRQIFQKLRKGGYIAIGDLEKEDGSFHNEQVPHKGFEQEEICNYLNTTGFKLVLCETYNVITKPTEQGIKDFKQFIIIAKK
jgi:ubiquinone/menaquinone biosynthesis C-methylase UbiE